MNYLLNVTSWGLIVFLTYSLNVAHLDIEKLTAELNEVREIALAKQTDVRWESHNTAQLDMLVNQCAKSVTPGYFPDENDHFLFVCAGKRAVREAAKGE